MENYKNLLDVIEKSNEEISYYLEDVSVEQFKRDVLDLAKINTDKQFISEMIKNADGERFKVVFIEKLKPKQKKLKRVTIDPDDL